MRFGWWGRRFEVNKTGFTLQTLGSGCATSKLRVMSRAGRRSQLLEQEVSQLRAETAPWPRTPGELLVVAAVYGVLT